ELFQHWSVEFHEPITSRDLAPFRKNVISFRAGRGKKITESAKGLHTDSKTKGNHGRAAGGDASTQTGTYEPCLRLNKARPETVKIRHDGQNGGMVGGSSRHARDRLLRERRRSHDRSQGRADEASQ